MYICIYTYIYIYTYVIYIYIYTYMYIYIYIYNVISSGYWVLLFVNYIEVSSVSNYIANQSAS